MNRKNNIVSVVAVVSACFVIVSGSFLAFNIIKSYTLPSVASQTRDIQELTDSQLLPAAYKYATAGSAEKAKLLLQTIKFSEQRKQKMIALMKRDAAAAVGVAMPEAQRASLPKEARQNVETATSVEGQLSVTHWDDFANEREIMQYGVRQKNGKGVEIYLADPPSITTLTSAADTNVRVRGYKLGHDMAIPKSGNPVGLAGAAGAPTGSAGVTAATSGGVGTKKLAVMMVTFPGRTNLGFTGEQLKQELFGATGNTLKNFYHENSFGQTNITGDVMGPYALNVTGPSGGCSWNAQTTWIDAARKAAQSAGVNLSTYTNSIIVFPKSSECPGGGVADVRGTRVAINGKSTNWYSLFAHELGHNFGEWHSSSLNCTSNGQRVVFTGTCTTSEYGDPFSFMGKSSAHRHMTVSQKGQIGYLKPVNTLTVTGDGTYTITPTETMSAGVQTIRIKLKTPFSANNSQGGKESYPYYYMEYRQPYGFDNFAATDPVVKGILVRLGGDYAAAPIHTQLLDMTPETPSYNDAALAVGRSFAATDGSNFTITVQSVSPSGAVVKITGLGGSQTPPPAADTTPPSAPSLTGTVSGTTARLTWSASTDNVGVAGYEVYRDGTLIQSVSPATRTYDNTGLRSGTSYRYTVKAKDAASNAASSNQITLTTGSPDTTPPSTPTGLRSVSVTASQVNLTWTASTDNVGVAGYDIMRGGVKVASVTTTSFGDGGLSPSTTYTYKVVAYDAAGNRGAASVQISVSTAAQTGQTGIVKGYVHTYYNPRPVSGAAIGLYNPTTGVLYRNAVTGSQGTFQFDAVPPGKYIFKVYYNHSLVTNRTITVEANKTSSWDIWVY